MGARFRPGRPQGRIHDSHPFHPPFPATDRPDKGKTGQAASQGIHTGLVRPGINPRRSVNHIPQGLTVIHTAYAPILHIHSDTKEPRPPFSPLSIRCSFPFDSTIPSILRIDQRPLPFIITPSWRTPAKGRQSSMLPEQSKATPASAPIYCHLSDLCTPSAKFRQESKVYLRRHGSGVPSLDGSGLCQSSFH